MSQFTFKITSSAIKRVQQLIHDDPSQPFLRVSVDGGGCSGFQYRYEFTDKKENNDRIIEEGGVTLLIDKLSEVFLKNSTLEYVQELGAQYFQVINPEAKHKCGCGKSFSMG